MQTHKRNNQKNSLQFVGFFLFVLFYGTSGSPTPDHIGIIEIIVLLSLCLIIRVKGFSNLFVVFVEKKSSTPILSNPINWLALFFIWATVCSTPLGLFYGHSVQFLIRDYISIIFLCMPLFLAPYLGSDTFRNRLFATIIAIGALFSGRVLPQDQADTGTSHALYLSISPEILFAATITLAMALTTPLKKIHHIGLALIIAYLCAYTFVSGEMRAAIGACILTIILINIWLFIIHPKHALKVMILQGIILLFTQQQWQPLLGALQQKQISYGLNLRGEELQAVFNQLNGALPSYLFGLGLGAGIESPSSAGLYVNYTHSLFSSLLLKTGVVGLGLLIGTLVTIAIKLIKNISLRDKKAVSLTLALTITLFINMLLYGGYKSIGFGLCFALLISLCFIKKQKDN